MDRLWLERRQLAVYLPAIAGGVLLGAQAPGVAQRLEPLLWPLLGALLFVTFLQTPFRALREALQDRRFLLALLAGQFLLIPLGLWLLQGLLPADPAVRLGLLLVLLVPCTDWFISFCQLGRGDVARAVAVTPLTLLLQLALLPAYLALFGVTASLPPLAVGTVVAALAVVALPLAAALAWEHGLGGRPTAERWRERLAWGPVPLLALVMALIAATQFPALRDGGGVLIATLPWFLGFLLAALALAWALARILGLPPEQGRTLAFGFGTRNSFIVLPLALALPAGWEATAAVIVLQSVVELLGMLAYLSVVPARLFPAPARPLR